MKVLVEPHQSKEPVLITEHGLSSAYLLDVTDYEVMVSRMRILEGIAFGERAIKEKRLVAHSKAKERLGKWLK